MSQLSKQIFMKAPVEVVWAVWSDVEKTPLWVDGVKDSRITSAVKFGPGLCWQEQCLFGSNHIEMDHKIVVWEEKKRAAVRTGLPMNAALERVIEFRPSGEGTQIDISLSWELGMISIFLSDDKFAAMLEKSLETTLQNWKSRSENF